MGVILFSLAVISLVGAHYLKIYRLEQFINIYERPDRKKLLRALSYGYILNFIIPFRLGDIFRAWYSGRKMKNGLSFSLSTVLVDRLLDIIIVGFIFIVFYLVGIRNSIVSSSIWFYVIGSLILILGFSVCYKNNKYIKIIIKKIAGIFNEKIELKILKFSWYIITSLKDLMTNLNKIKIYCSTIFMWILYLLSYMFFAQSIQLFGCNMNFMDVFILLFSKNSLNSPTLGYSYLSLDNYLMLLYLLIPLILLIILSFVPFKSKNDENYEDKYLELLPHVNFHDKLVFLEAYFSAQSKEYFQNYIKLNRDIAILEDYSAGSNATTILVTDSVNTFFRKYSFGKDSEKLYEQVIWLNNHKNDINLTDVVNIKHGDGYCSYDMPYIKEAVSCFNYVHSTPIDEAWEVIEKSLKAIDKGLHKKNVKNAEINMIEQYIEVKAINNIKKIENGQYIKPLLKYDYLIINGKKYHNFGYFKKFLSKDYLLEVFKNDIYSDIHGDFTIENIICINNKSKNNYYIIDPNTGNLHDSPNLDYAKLLQSLHGGYEFLMKTKSIQIQDNNINFLFTKSLVYDKLYFKYKEYLNKKFNKKVVKSIYFHEIIHWLRLMPYKIEKNGERSVLFYSGLIIILNDLIELCGEK